MTATFDIDQHQRDRLRRLEARTTMLEQQNAKLHRLLALALLSACAGTNVDPTDLLWAIEELDAG